jgi:hypothetical protein
MKTMVRNHDTPIQTAKMKNSDHTKYSRCGETGSIANGNVRRYSHSGK